MVQLIIGQKKFTYIERTGIADVAQCVQRWEQKKHILGSPMPIYQMTRIWKHTHTHTNHSVHGSNSQSIFDLSITR